MEALLAFVSLGVGLAVGWWALPGCRAWRLQRQREAEVRRLLEERRKRRV